MPTLNEKLQNIHNRLSLLLPQLGKICVRKIGLIPIQIEKIVVGVNKLSLYVSDSTPYEINENDLKYTSSIKDYAFRNCTSLTNITIPDSVTRIGGLAFYNCQGLTSITIPDSVTTIGVEAFEACSYLTHVEISERLTSIGSYAFFLCSSLTSIKIPNSVTYIGSGAFEYCDLLANIYLHPTTPPSLSNTDAIPNTTTIHVPIGSGDAYKSATNWSYHSSRIVEDIEI